MLKVLKLRPVRGASGEAPVTVAPQTEAPHTEDDLADLVARCRAGDDRAARTLLGALGPPMLQVIRRVLGAHHPDVEDTLQEATIAVLRAFASFRGECTARHFAGRIAAFAAINARRRRPLPLAEPSEVGEVDDQPADDGDGAADRDWAVAARRRELVRRLLDELPPPQAEALVLHCIVGLTMDEVASVTGAPMETARSRLRLAKASLRVRIAGDRAAADLVGGTA